MADQQNDPNEKTDKDIGGNDVPDQDVEQTEARRFDPEALITENNEDRMEDDAIYVDDMYGDWFSFGRRFY